MNLAELAFVPNSLHKLPYKGRDTRGPGELDEVSEKNKSEKNKSEQNKPAQWNLAGQVALVSGASQGIGRAVAQKMVRAGAEVVLLSRNSSALEELAKELAKELAHGSGGPALFSPRVFAQDLSDLEGLEQGLEALISELGKPIGIYVANSGGPPSGPLTEAPAEHFEQALRSHVLAPQLIVQKLLPGMRAQGWGRVINVISTSVKTPLPNLGVSNTIRAAVASWAKTLAGELGVYGITVNNVLPGYTATERLSSLMQAAAQRQGLTTEQVEQQWKKNVPMGRFAEPEEVAEAVVFLASQASGYINGINLPVDGGRTACL